MLACDRCRVDKKKCSREIPCERCSQRGQECTYTANSYETEVATRQNKLESRLKTLENVLLNYVGKEYGADMNIDILTFISQGLGKRSFNEFRSPILSDFANLSININSDSAISVTAPIYDSISSAQLKLFFGAYVRYSYRSYPFLNLRHLQLLFKVRPFYTPILYVTYLIGQLILIRKNRTESYPLIEENQFYKLARYLLSTQSDDTSLLNIQALILLADVELQNGLGNEGSLHSLQAVRKLQMLGVDKEQSKSQSSSSLMYQRELEATWAMAKRTDALVYMSAGIPQTIQHTKEDWERSTDHYKSFELIDSMVQSSDRNSFDISEEELTQYLRYLSMELYCFSCALTDKFSKFKNLAQESRTIDRETFLSKFDLIVYFFHNHPFYTVDGKTFNEKFSTDHPQFNLFAANYLLFQSHSITFSHIIIDFLEEANMYDYPSPASSSEKDIAYYKERLNYQMDNLIEVVYNSDPQRKQFIDSLINIDYIFAIPHYYIQRFRAKQYGTQSQDQIIDAYEYWPCLQRIFIINQTRKEGRLHKEIVKVHHKAPPKPEVYQTPPQSSPKVH